MINFYLIYVLKVAKEGTGGKETPIALAIVPVIIYIATVCTSSVIPKLSKRFGRKKTFTIGAVL